MQGDNASLPGISSSSSRSFSKKKMAVIFGYKGTEFSGVQFQFDPKVRTVEKDLYQAMFDAGGILEANMGDPKKLSWHRAARTDKKVHALVNVISLKLNPALTAQDLNSALKDKDEIRVFGIVRTLGSFDAREMCSSRIYDYVLPSFAFDRSFSSLLDREKEQRDFRISLEDTERISSILEKFQGEHDFCNFSSGESSHKAKRFIRSFKFVEKFIREENGFEFICLRVHGNSFVYHQIRKMVGTMLAIFHGILSEDILTSSSWNAAFSHRVLFHLPLAPGDGLYLRMLDFKTYNNAKKMQDLKVSPLIFDEYADEMQKFREEVLLPELCGKRSMDEFNLWLEKFFELREFWGPEDGRPIPESLLKRRKVDVEDQDIR